MCKEKTELIDHLELGCRILIPIVYNEKHHKIGHYIQWKISKSYGILKCEKRCKRQPEIIEKTKEVIILWDFAIQTEWKIKRNRPDIVIKDNKRKTCLSINMSVPTGYNISIKNIVSK